MCASHCKRHQVGDELVHLVARRASTPASAQPGLNVVGIGDPGAQILRACSGGPRGERRRLIRCVRSGPKVPLAGGAADRWQLTQASDRKTLASRLRARDRRAPAPAARPPSGRTPPADRRRRAAACWRAACRSTRRTGRRRVPARRGSNHMRLVLPGIRSVLPASRGTQKLWHTSADFSVRKIGRRARRIARRDVQLVGGDDAELGVADLPPPLVADDGDVEGAWRGCGCRSMPKM